MALLLQNGSYLQLQTGGSASGKILLKGDPGAVFHALAPPWRTANFGDGTTIVSWTSALDPSERKIYTVNAATELNGINDTISSVNVELSGLAALVGLRIYGVTNDLTQVSIWFEINPADRARPGWASPGETHLVTVTITSMGGHIFQRDISLRILQL
jgi:hypothetical protein